MSDLYCQNNADLIALELNNVAFILSPSNTTTGNTTTTSTLTGPTDGVRIGRQWVSAPLHAAVTISGTITPHIYMMESSMSANVGADILIERCDAVGTVISTIARSEKGTELGTSYADQTWAITPTSTAMKKGDRIKVTFFGNDGGGTMASGYTFGLGFGSTTYPTRISFTETLDFTVPDAPVSQLYLLDSGSNFSPSAPGLISDFTGADESPLSEGGNWSILDSNYNAMQRLSGATTAITNSQFNGSYWNVADIGPDVEAYATLATISATIGVGILIRGQDCGGASTFDGYSVEASSDRITLNRWTNGLKANLNTYAATISAGYKVGISAHTNVICAYLWTGATWRKILEVTDSVGGYSNAGKVAVYSNTTGSSLDDFYAGEASGVFDYNRDASLTAGASATVRNTDTASGPTLGIQMRYSAIGQPLAWWSPRLEAVTIAAGSILTVNVWGYETSLNANACWRARAYRTDGDGKNQVLIAAGTYPQELATTAGVMQFIIQAGAVDIDLADGDRILIHVLIDDTTGWGSMGAGYSVYLRYGYDVANTSETWIGFEQTFTTYTPPASTPPHLNQYPQLLAQ